MLRHILQFSSIHVSPSVHVSPKMYASPQV